MQQVTYAPQTFFRNIPKSRKTMLHWWEVRHKRIIEGECLQLCYTGPQHSRLKVNEFIRGH
jgi:hypothetical protein